MYNPRLHRFLWAAPLAAALLASRADGQALTYNFNVAGPASWGDTQSWDSFTVPVGQFNEIGAIGAGRSAYVDALLPPPAAGGIVVSSGTLEIRSGGTLSAVAAAFVDGGLVVGQAGTGTVQVRRGGTLDVQTISMGGAAASSLILGETGGAGTATLTTAGGTLSRTTRVIGDAVAFSSSGDLTFAAASRLVAEITGPAHSAINVAGTATLGGTLAVELNGFAPSLGHSWNIVSAGSLSGSFSAIDTSALPSVARGTGYNVKTVGGTASLEYIAKPILIVDRGNGAVRIENVVNSAITLDGYSVGSAGGNLSTAAWNSLQDQMLAGWDQADNSSASRLTEFNPSNSSTLNMGNSLNLGAIFAPTAPTALGQLVDGDLTFQYAILGQTGTKTGDIEYVGRRNHVVLTINPTTGEAAIQNESPYFNASIDAYTISSAVGGLLPGSWDSLQSQSLAGWDEADNSNAFRVTEFNPSGATLLSGGGQVLNLGAVFDVSGGAPDLDDLLFQFTLEDGTELTGIIALGMLPTPMLAGDANGDGKVDIFDVAVVSNNWGTSGPTGDVNHDGQVDIFDVALISNNWGAMLGSAAATTVPEPSSVALLSSASLALVGCGCRRVRRKSSAAT